MHKLIIAALLVGGVASADTFYYVGGKSMTAAEATKASILDPKVEVLKVSVNFTKVSAETSRLRKVRPASIKDIPNGK